MSSGFFVHVFLISPISNHFLEPKNYPRPKGVYYALAFLALAASATVWYELQDTPMNHYRFMDIDRRADMVDIKRAYRKKSIELHPDKNPNNPNADNDFARLGAINDVLTDKRMREAYDTWGPERVEFLKDKRNAASESDTQLIINMGMFYVVWAVLGYFLTLGKVNDQAKMYYYGGLIGLGCFEFSCKFMGGDHLTFIRRFTVFEQVDILHRFFPAYLNACRVLSQATFVDEEKHMHMVLEHLALNQKQIINMLIHVINNTEKKGRAKAMADSGVNAGDAAANPTLPVDVREQLARAQGLMGTNPRAQMGPNSAVKAKKKEGSSGMWNFVWMVGVYAFFNYVLG